MSRNKTTNLLVCYDIRDDKRLQKIHRCMCHWGLPLQYSVFHCKLTSRQRTQMENDLRGLMDERVDDIRVYGMLSLSQARFIGHSPFPEGMLLPDDIPRIIKPADGE